MSAEHIVNYILFVLLLIYLSVTFWLSWSWSPSINLKNLESIESDKEENDSTRKDLKAWDYRTLDKSEIMTVIMMDGTSASEAMRILEYPLNSDRYYLDLMKASNEANRILERLASNQKEENKND